MVHLQTQKSKASVKQKQTKQKHNNKVMVDLFLIIAKQTSFDNKCDFCWGPPDEGHCYLIDCSYQYNVKENYNENQTFMGIFQGKGSESMYIRSASFLNNNVNNNFPCIFLIIGAARYRIKKSRLFYNS